MLNFGTCCRYVDVDDGIARAPATGDFSPGLETLHDRLTLRTIGHFAILSSGAAGKIGLCRVFDAQHGHNTAAAADR
jgi:hypothetical protein